MGQAHNLNSSRESGKGWGGHVSLEPTGSQLLLAQNHPHTKETHLGITYSELLQGVGQNPTYTTLFL